MSRGALGRQYGDGEWIIRQGDVGNDMFVVQDGHVEVIRQEEGEQAVLAELGPGDCFGEMAIFEREVRSASVRSRGTSRVLTVDKRTLLRRFQEDPSLALNILETLSHRIRVLDAEVVRARDALQRLRAPGSML